LTAKSNGDGEGASRVVRIGHCAEGNGLGSARTGIRDGTAAPVSGLEIHLRKQIGGSVAGFNFKLDGCVFRTYKRFAGLMPVHANWSLRLQLTTRFAPAGSVPGART
jgi:hypothetical protein